LIVRGDFSPRSGYLAARRLFSHPHPPTAIFACNDMMAIGALRALAELRLAVPDAVAVIGFDDIELASYASPPLTTIRQDKVALGQAAVRLLSRAHRTRLRAERARRPDAPRQRFRPGVLHLPRRRP
jgi:LacI family transcriptional regulator